MTTQLNGDTGVSAIQPGVIVDEDLNVACGGFIPIGGSLNFYGATAPANYLALPLVPTNISRTTYAKLFAAIDTAWGVGDGSTTFGMPYCPANHVEVQANANVGTSTVGEVLNHVHYNGANYAANTAAGAQGYYATASGQNTGNVVSGGGSANLAAGIRVLKCVRYQ